MAITPRNTAEVGLSGSHVTPSPPAPSRFATFTMDSIGITDTRSRHNDTDFVNLSATVGARPTVFVTKSLGDVNNGTHSVGLSIEVDIPDDDTIVVFNYLIVNNGHGGNDAKTKAVQSALSTIAEEIIKHPGTTATAITVGLIAVPLVGSALVAVAGILAVTEAGLLLFADCDGVVAAGAIRFTCSDLIKRTSSGQRFPKTRIIAAPIHRTAAAPTRGIPRHARSRRRLRSKLSWI